MILYNNVLQKHFIGHHSFLKRRKYPVIKTIATGNKSLTYYLCFPYTAEHGKACHCFAPNNTIKRYQQLFSNLCDHYFPYQQIFEASNTQTINN